MTILRWQNIYRKQVIVSVWTKDPYFNLPWWLTRNYLNRKFLSWGIVILIQGLFKQSESIIVTIALTSGTRSCDGQILVEFWLLPIGITFLLFRLKYYLNIWVYLKNIYKLTNTFIFNWVHHIKERLIPIRLLVWGRVLSEVPIWKTDT